MNVKDYREQVEAGLNSAAGSNVAALSANVQAPQEDVWDRALKLLADPAQSPEVRQTALQQLQAGTFLGSQFAPFHAEYLVALRSAATDSDAGLRRAALDILANFKDDFARDKLMAGLRDAKEALVAPAVALGLLARDDHGSAHQIARDILDTVSDVHTREQAVRLLGSDPTAQPILSAIMKDKAEFREVRRASAVALRSLDADAFNQSAQEILSDDDDFHDIKATIKGALDLSGTPLGDAELAGANE